MQKLKWLAAATLVMGLACGDKDTPDDTESEVDDTESAVDDTSPTAEDCGNGADDDGDGATDCDDSDCAADPDCQPSGEASVNGTLEPCSSDLGTTIDSWIVSINNDSVVLVDTVSGDNTFDPGLAWAEVGSPADSYPLGDDEFECSYPPPAYSCPSGPLSAGNYELLVMSYGNCVDEAVGGYQLRIDGDGTIDRPGEYDNYIYQSN